MKVKRMFWWNLWQFGYEIRICERIFYRQKYNEKRLYERSKNMLR